MRIVDICAFYSPKGGGVRTYIELKLTIGPRLAHYILVIAPGPRHSVFERGPLARTITLPGPRFPLDLKYRYFNDERVLHEALTELKPDIVEVSSPWRRAVSVARWRGLSPRALIMHASPLSAYAYRWIPPAPQAWSGPGGVSAPRDPRWRSSPCPNDVCYQTASYCWGILGYTPAHLVRLALAFIFALPVGWNRNQEERSASLCTFPIVGIASRGLVILAIEVLGERTPEQTRIREGLFTRVGFVGGGTILKSGDSVHGTATAASVLNVGVIGGCRLRLLRPRPHPFVLEFLVLAVTCR